MNKPKPETITAQLQSEGYASFRVTKHQYVDTREAMVTGPNPEAWAFYFRCSETGEERVWGMVDRAGVIHDDEGDN